MAVFLIRVEFLFMQRLPDQVVVLAIAAFQVRIQTEQPDLDGDRNLVLEGRFQLI